MFCTFSVLFSRSDGRVQSACPVAGQRLSVSDHASFESSILPGTPLPGIAEERNKKNATTLVAAQAAATVAAPAASAIAKATLAELKHYHFGSLDKETAGLPIASDPDLVVSSTSSLGRSTVRVQPAAFFSSFFFFVY